MRRHALLLLLALPLAGCAAVPLGEQVVVQNTGEEEFLNLRAGPSLGYSVILGLPEGTLLTQRSCVTELNQLWCQVSLANAPGVTGYVSADYIAPR
ncbi:SH3 domain-containing protein [Pseudoroseicyclus sp. H15]